ncbi:alpha/beta hydrolase [Antrihabitans sp. YC2-6]|uniref:alpha/beta hydrolase n=1 Tax=Antrihabitans sp. YC2-6 TaxID=2799498 RepID=UPI0018F30798|nr:alpha/beta hydrolase [Antrihabitans sp. YC2-6]MBJ8343713.1 alpha/beta hydrolase [Antrihabitans sp. YC2-6]
MAIPPYLHPFVVPVAEWPRQREGSIDVYRPAEPGGDPLPVVVFVHGGPLPPGLEVGPRDWPIYLGYGALAAGSGVVGVTVEHRLQSTLEYATAAADVADAVTQSRELPGVDPDRVALWFFSGGGLLSADWLRKPPPWLRCVALTYPILSPPPGWGVDEKFDPADAVATVGGLPVLLTRVGRERPEFAATVEAFTAAAREHEVDLEVIDVPNGQHGFDTFDHTEESRDAVVEAMKWVTATLQK